MNKINRIVATTALCALVAACGGGGGGGSDAPAAPPAAPAVATAADNFFPLDSNARLTYTSDSQAEPIVVRVMGTQSIAGGATGTAVRRQEFSRGLVQHRVYVAMQGGVRQYAATGADAIERAFDGSELVRWPTAAGDTFVQLDTTVDSNQDFDGDGVSDRVVLRADVITVGLESLTTPAGPFTPVLHMRQVLKQTVLPSTGAARVVVQTTTDTWLASGIGIVKRVVVQLGNGADSTATEEITKFRVGTRGNDFEAPAVQSETPQFLGNATAQVTAVFTEVVDEDSFKAEAFRVVDSNGRPVPGSVSVSGRSVRFVPDQTWPEGRYTATVGTGVTDLFGNRPSVAHSWSFSIDATAPGVVDHWPPDDAINVRLDASLSVTMSETLRASSVDAATVKLAEGGNAVPVTLSVSGSALLVQPTSALRPGRHYTLQIGGLTDAAGNSLAQPRSFSFDTTPGRFGSTERLFAQPSVPGAFADAVGDINGDGIPDVAFTITGEIGASIYKYSLYVRTGRPDGRLNEPVRVDVGPMNTLCDLNALVIGDVTGDGRADVVVGSLICGVLVLRQTESGTLEQWQYIDTRANVLRLVDMDGDGRMDLVGVNDSEAVARVWRQGTDGRLALVQTPSLGGEVARDVEVGDLDGDGRPDLVVSLLVVGRSPNLAVLRQQADGTFAAPTFLNTGSVWGATGIALGDLNGDGRLDIVATTGGNAPTWFAIFYQAADGSFPTVTQVPTADSPWAVRIADVDRDGRADIVVSHRGHYLVGIYLQKPGGALAREELYEGPYGTQSLQTLVVSDLDRDGLLDIVISGEVIRQRPLAGASALRVNPVPASPPRLGRADAVLVR